MHKISGADATHLYAAGGGGILFSTDNRKWVPQVTLTTEGITAVWGPDAANVYACTSAGHLYCPNGRAWSVPQLYISSSDITCEDSWGTVPDNLYLATSSGIFHGTP